MPWQRAKSRVASLLLFNFEVTFKCGKIEAKRERELEKLDETEEIYFAENMTEYLFYLLGLCT